MSTAMGEVSEPLLKHELDGAAPLPDRQPRTVKRNRYLSAVLSIAILLTLVTLHQYGAVPEEPLVACPGPEALHITAPRKNVWKNLDVPEAIELRRWLMDDARGLNLTAVQHATESDNFIHIVEVLSPPKAEAVAFLANGTSFDRYAHAIIQQGATESIVDYLVGPLPLSAATTVRPLSERYHNPVPLNARSTFNYTQLVSLTVKLLAPLDPVTSDLFNVSIAARNLGAAGQAPMSYDGSWRRTWMQLKRDVPGAWLQSLDMYILVDLSGTDLSQFSVMAVVHAGKMYASIADVVAAWERGELTRPAPFDTSDWSSRVRRGKTRDLDDRAGPRSILPAGARYRVDLDNDYVSWMGWTFYLSFQRDMGVHLWDINFRGERIIYELAPQEAMAQYSGSDPHQAATVWLDRAFGMGGTVREVIVGYDCPDHATLLNATVHEMGSTTRRNAICVFERESGRPLSRHTGYGANEMGAVKGYELVVRSISTVGNYDYIFDYTFQLDGTLEVRLSASGYLQGGAYDASQAPYGHQLRPNMMGSLHDHIINYKIDFDVAGAQNSFMEVAIERETVHAPWFDMDGWGPVTQSRLRREIVKEEALLDYPANMQGAYVVVNQDELNRWGNPRGYTIHPGPLCKLANTDAKRTERSVQWAKQHLAVSRRKEDEPESSSMWNGNLPGAPPVDFYKFFNNESIEQHDLVVWANLGTHHIPRAEDAPNTLTNVATSYMLLAPWNFHDYDVSIESANSVLINPQGNYQVDEPVQAPHCAPRPPAKLTYHAMDGWREDGTPVTPDEINAARSHAVHAMGMWARPG